MDSFLGISITITLNNPIIVVSDDGSEYDGDGLHPKSQESSASLPPLVLTTIWDCPGITLDEIVDAKYKMIKGWHCRYCPIHGGLGAAPFFKYQIATKALSHLSSKGQDIASWKGLMNIPAYVCIALTASRHDKDNKKTNHAIKQNILIDKVVQPGTCSIIATK